MNHEFAFNWDKSILVYSTENQNDRSNDVSKFYLQELHWCAEICEHGEQLNCRDQLVIKEFETMGAWVTKKHQRYWNLRDGQRHTNMQHTRMCIMLLSLLIST